MLRAAPFARLALAGRQALVGELYEVKILTDWRRAQFGIRPRAANDAFDSGAFSRRGWRLGVVLRRACRVLNGGKHVVQRRERAGRRDKREVDNALAFDDLVLKLPDPGCERGLQSREDDVGGVAA
jgi:hypothetical protein